MVDYIRGEVHVSTKEEKDIEEIKVTVNFEQHMEMKWGEQLRVYDPNHFVQYTRVSDPFEWGYLS